jgi:hypothetical protein
MTLSTLAAILLHTSALCAAPPPDGWATLRTDDVDATLSVSPCPAGAQCVGSSVSVPPGEYDVTLRAPRMRPVRSRVTLTAGQRLVHGPEMVLPIWSQAEGWASTAVAVGAALVATTVVILAQGGGEGRDMRIGAPIAAGLGSCLMIGGVWGLRSLAEDSRRIITGSLDLLPIDPVPAP